jgi:hypothetical protein
MMGPWPIKGCGARLASEAEHKFGERHSDTITGGHVGGEFVVAAAYVLHERAWPAAMVRRERIVFSPRIGRSRALSRAWSASARLFAYWSGRAAIHRLAIFTRADLPGIAFPLRHDPLLLQFRGARTSRACAHDRAGDGDPDQAPQRSIVCYLDLSEITGLLADPSGAPGSAAATARCSR